MYKLFEPNKNKINYSNVFVGVDVSINADASCKDMRE